MKSIFVENDICSHLAKCISLYIKDRTIQYATYHNDYNMVVIHDYDLNYRYGIGLN